MNLTLKFWEEFFLENSTDLYWKSRSGGVMSYVLSTSISGLKTVDDGLKNDLLNLKAKNTNHLNINSKQEFLNIINDKIKLPQNGDFIQVMFEIARIIGNSSLSVLKFLEKKVGKKTILESLEILLKTGNDEDIRTLEYFYRNKNLEEITPEFKDDLIKRIFKLTEITTDRKYLFFGLKVRLEEGADLEDIKGFVLKNKKDVIFLNKAEEILKISLGENEEIELDAGSFNKIVRLDPDVLIRKFKISKKESNLIINTYSSFLFKILRKDKVDAEMLGSNLISVKAKSLNSLELIQKQIQNELKKFMMVVPGLIGKAKEEIVVVFSNLDKISLYEKLQETNQVNGNSKKIKI